MKLHFTSGFSDKLKTVKRNNPKLAERLRKHLEIFEKDPRYPSLRNHKLKGELKNCWSISFGGNLRATYFVDGETAVFYDFGTHDEVYRR